MNPEDRLDSWKAIARYLGRSVRTVRRWEQQAGLPVHRLMHQSQASIYAFKKELDAWRRSRAKPSVRLPPSDSGKTTGNADSLRPEPATGVTTAAIAVLPFSFAGPDPSQAWVADGLTEEVIGEFSRLAKLRVTSRTSSANIKNINQDSGSIAKLLGVSHLLEGSVVGDGRRLRINIRLIDPQRDEHVWSKKFAGEMDDVFDIQERIARAVVDALKLELEPWEKDRIGQPGVANLSAWRRVILARQTAFQWRPDALEKARALLIEALTLTGENATICATLGRVLLHHVEVGTPDRQRVLEEAKSWEARARKADPDHPEARILSAWLAHVTGDLEYAIKDLETALEADHDHPDALVLLAHCLLRVGLVDRARPVIEHAIAVDPLTPLTRCFPGYLAAMEGRFDEAVKPYLHMLEGDSANPVSRLFCVWICFAAGNNKEAAALARGFEEGALDSTPAWMARQFVAAHQGTLSDLTVPESIILASESSEMYCRHAAEAWALEGDTRKAAAWLERAINLGFVNWPYLALHSPFLSPLAEDPAVHQVLAKAKTRWKAVSGTLSTPT